MCTNSIMYRNLPNKGAGRSSKVKSDRFRKKPKFSAFQQWFRIENRSIIKETMSILAIYDSIRFLQTKGGALIREGALNWQITVLSMLCLHNDTRMYEKDNEIF